MSKRTVLRVTCYFKQFQMHKIFPRQVVCLKTQGAIVKTIRYVLQHGLISRVPVSKSRSEGQQSLFAFRNFSWCNQSKQEKVTSIQRRVPEGRAGTVALLWKTKIPSMVQKWILGFSFDVSIINNKRSSNQPIPLSEWKITWRKCDIQWHISRDVYWRAAWEVRSGTLAFRSAQ